MYMGIFRYSGSDPMNITDVKKQNLTEDFIKERGELVVLLFIGLYFENLIFLEANIYYNILSI